jgi:hypothetical protein
VWEYNVERWEYGNRRRNKVSGNRYRVAPKRDAVVEAPTSALKVRGAGRGGKTKTHPNTNPAPGHTPRSSPIPHRSAAIPGLNFTVSTRKDRIEPPAQGMQNPAEALTDLLLGERWPRT